MCATPHLLARCWLGVRFTISDDSVWRFYSVRMSRFAMRLTVKGAVDGLAGSHEIAFQCPSLIAPERTTAAGAHQLHHGARGGLDRIPLANMGSHQQLSGGRA